MRHRREHATLAPLPVLGFCGAALVTVADQATKEIVRASLAYGETIPVTGFVNIVFHHNRGAAFGMFASGGWQAAALLAFGAAAMAALSILLLRVGRDRWSAAAFAVILGGATGNVIDRIRHGAVVDWLDFHVAAWHWPAFNLADAALTLGVAIFLLVEMTARGAPPGKQEGRA